jgi:hypothetical protein
MDVPTVLRMPLIAPPRKMSATMAVSASQSFSVVN